MLSYVEFASFFIWRILLPIEVAIMITCGLFANRYPNMVERIVFVTGILIELFLIIGLILLLIKLMFE